MPNNYLVVLAVERPNEQKSQLLTCVRTSVLLPYFPFIELNIFNFPSSQICGNNMVYRSVCYFKDNCNSLLTY